jgi:hypothetical protein
MSQDNNETSARNWKTGALQVIWLLTFCLILSHQTVNAQAQAGFEQRTILKASSLLGADLLKSNLYTVDEEVINDGLLNHYTVRSIFGVFRPNSTQAAKQVLHEIRAIAAMKKVETKSTAKEAVVQSGKNTVDAVANLVTDPKETLEGAAAGVSSLFNRASQVAGKRQVTGAEDSQVEQLIGKSKSKGKIATKYGVSVYSLNPVLQQELDRLAWADYLGGIGVGLAQSAIPGAGGLLLTASGTARLLNDVINTTPASELWVRNKNKLEAMRIDSDTVQLFLNNPAFSPAFQTVMVDALENMQGVDNRGLFIKISLQANNHEMARVITMIATMTAGYHKNVAPLQSLAPVGRILYAKTKKGATVLVVPVDRILWTAKVADVATWLKEPVQGQVKPAGYQLWVLGDFSQKAQAELQGLGWELHPNAQGRLFQERKQKS